MKIAFDVDDTLIIPSVATGFPTDTPNYEVIALYRWFQAQGHYMIIWSGSGVDYAKRWAEKLGLHADEFPVKQTGTDVDLAFDDVSNALLGKVTVQVKRFNSSARREDQDEWTWNRTNA